MMLFYSALVLVFKIGSPFLYSPALNIFKPFLNPHFNHTLFSPLLEAQTNILYNIFVKILTIIYYIFYLAICTKYLGIQANVFLLYPPYAW